MFMYAPFTLDGVIYDAYKYDEMLYLSVVKNHPITFYDPWKDKKLILPPSGWSIRGSQYNKIIKQTDKYKIMTIQYDSIKSEQKKLNKIVDYYPDIIIIGSKIAAITYKHVKGLVKYQTDDSSYTDVYNIRIFFEK